MVFMWNSSPFHTLVCTRTSRTPRVIFLSYESERTRFPTQPQSSSWRGTLELRVLPPPRHPGRSSGCVRLSGVWELDIPVHSAGRWRCPCDWRFNVKTRTFRQEILKTHLNRIPFLGKSGYSPMCFLISSKSAVIFDGCPISECDYKSLLRNSLNQQFHLVPNTIGGLFLSA